MLFEKILWIRIHIQADILNKLNIKPNPITCKTMNIARKSLKIRQLVHIRTSQMQHNVLIQS